ncbi:MAG: type VI secretion system baseplate subunit TssK [Bryobacteraceae bacterium]|nr:type VI secretion system baseplate subunit TssK [Solibacteraceae bacterium]MCO5352437.1 type VI secretion system baseplate subunit TssK [Bryobacteraceae bacterium]
MMLSRVVWSEGMHLGPHHFQVQNRYFESLVHFTSSSLSFEPWGLSGIQVDQDALRNGIFTLVHARGLFADGLAFLVPEQDQAPEPRQLGDIFPPMDDHLDMHLAVAPLDLKGANCVPEGAESDGLRYAANGVDVPDEMTGSDIKRIEVGRKNLQLLPASQVGGLISIPIARVLRETANQYALEPNFIPPVLRLQASERLMVLLRRIVDMLDERARQMLRPKDLAAGTAAGFSAEGISNAWFLHCVNAAITPLRHLLMQQTAHPEEVYMEMARLAGALCTFGLDSHPSTLPRYTHTQLTKVFNDLDLHIRTHLELIVPSNCVRLPLKHVSQYFWETQITDQRVLSHSRWILALRAKMGEADLLSGSPRLVKVCSKEFLPKLVSRALPGLQLVHLPSPPPAVSPRVDYQYFGIDRSGPCWDHMVATREVALYIPGEIPEPDVELMVVLES